MPDNLSVSISADTGKARAELSLLQAELRKTTSELRKASDAAVRSGDRTRVNELSAVYETLRQKTAGAGRGLHAVAAANMEVAETSRVSVREIAKISKELGSLEVSGFAVAKMFKELPKVAIPVAVVAGVATAIGKLSNEAYKSITSLDDLSKSTGFASRELVALQHVFEGADVSADVLNKTVSSIAESFDKAKIKAGDLGSMMYGVQTFRGPAGAGGAGYGPGGATQSTTPGLSNYVAPASQGVGPGVGAFQQGVAVMRGGQPLGIDPSKGLAGLVDPNQFKTVEEFFAAARRALVNINQFSPLLAREIVRGQGLDPAALRGLSATTADQYHEALGATAGDPRFRAGAVQLARQFGAESKEAGARGERATTEAGIPAMEAAIPALKAYGDAVEAVGEQIKKTREESGQLNDALTKGVDSGELGASTSAFAGAWTSAFDQIRNSWNATAAYMSSLPGGGGQAGQVIPLAPAGGMASGGLVRGPGTGTSDSILARLSAGEFVVNSARVRQVGLGFLQRLNGFADGGLVPSMAFASGGLVPSAGGGTPVHLHLGGQSFVTHATSSVAAALVSEAHAQQIRSAGTKPSWFAGRPGGQ